MANALSIKKAQEQGNATRGTSVIVYGPPKSGKTALVAQLAKHYKLIWLDIERGSATLFNEDVVDPALLGNIELFQIPDYKKQPIAIEYAMKLFKGEVLELCDKHSMHSCSKCRVHNMRHPDDKWESTKLDLMALDPNEYVVVLDSLTQLTRSAAAYITKKQLQGDDAKFEFDHWRLQNTYVDIVLDMAQAGMFNSVCITHEQGIEQTDGTEKITPSGSTKNYARSIAKNFDVVVYTFQNGTRHSLASQTSEQPKAITGSRIKVNIAKDGMAAIFNPALRTAPEPKKEAKGTSAVKTSTGGVNKLLSRRKK